MRVISVKVFTTADDWDGYHIQGADTLLFERVESINILSDGNISIDLGNGKFLLFHGLRYIATTIND